MPEMTVNLADRRARRKLGALRGFVSGGRYTGPGGAAGARAFGDTMRVVGVMALDDIREHFNRQSQPGSSWPALGDVTVVLRRGGPKIYGPADIAKKRTGLKKLRDTNLLYLSLEPGGQGNALEVLPREVGVRVGTRLKRAKRLQKGGRSRFEFDEKRFSQNVSAVKRGRKKPARRKDGARRAWKAEGKESPWNEFFFRMRGALRTMAGRSYAVPARPFVVRAALRYGRYVAVVRRRLGEIFR